VKQELDNSTEDVKQELDNSTEDVKQELDNSTEDVKQELDNSTEDVKQEFSNLSYKLTRQISKIDKKNNGIYFTPPTTIDRNITLLLPYLENIIDVLEPSCGSCEYILSLNNKCNNLNITGIELNKTIYESIEYISNDNIRLYNENFILYENLIKYDLIIGNPPYFVMKKKDVGLEYYDYFSGRPNIFILFIIKSLKLLKLGGILSFILPRGFLNCLYYDKTRNYVAKNYKIINILECNDNYIETKQDTILFIIQNNEQDNNIHNQKYILDINEYTIFGTEINIYKLKNLYNNSTNLFTLNFDVNVGNVVWNQCKSILTEDTNKTLLVYSSDISNKILKIKKYSNKDKKNYIDKAGCTDPVLVINRGYGVGSYIFDYCLIEGGFEFLIENHLICIKYTKTIDNNELIILYNQIINSLEDDRTKEFINLYFGNNAINTTELNYILPIFDFDM
jgi:tRNA1(Val) A37 N6-methylase TrmN6